MDKMPYVPKELITYLSTVFPDRCPNIKMSDREVWIAVGQAALVRHLTALYEEQVEQSLGSL